MNENIIYWLWLQCIFGVESRKVKSVTEYFDSIEDFYNSSETDKRLCGCFTDAELQKMENKDLKKAQIILDDCKRLGYNILSFADERYPSKLKEIAAPPCVLYVDGELPDIDTGLTVAVVGTREPTSFGTRAAFDFSYALAKSGAVVVSGGAVGIDSSAHKGVLTAGGKTVCVLGCGIDYKYLTKNISMRDEVAQHGAVISEYPPAYPPSRFTFPKRNRIISGLCDCTLVVEAGVKSGSLITAEYSAAEGRRIFVVPGDIFTAQAAGSNNLLRQGASVALNATDIISWYKDGNRAVNREAIRPASQNLEKSKKQAERNQPIHNHDNADESKTKNRRKNVKEKDKDNKNTTNTNENNAPLLELSDNAAKVYAAIGEEPMHVDKIAEASGLAIQTVLTSLSELEIMNYVVSCSGRRYIRK